VSGGIVSPRVEYTFEERRHDRAEGALHATFFEQVFIGACRSCLCRTFVGFVQAVQHRDGVAKVEVVCAVDDDECARSAKAIKEFCNARFGVDKDVVGARNEQRRLTARKRKLALVECLAADEGFGRRSEAARIRESMPGILQLVQPP
jgi:hypothetical protein